MARSDDKTSNTIVDQRLNKLPPESRAAAEEVLRRYGLDPHDPAAVLAVLYGDLHAAAETTPKRIADAANDAVSSARTHADTEAKRAARDVQKTLTEKVGDAVNRKAKARDNAWIAGAIVTVTVALAVIGYGGYKAGYGAGYGALQQTIDAPVLKQKRGELAVEIARANPFLVTMYRKECAPGGDTRDYKDIAGRAACRLPIWTTDSAPQTPSAGSGSPDLLARARDLLEQYSPWGILGIGALGALAARKILHESVETPTPIVKWLLR